MHVLPWLRDLTGIQLSETIDMTCSKYEYTGKYTYIQTYTHTYMHIYIFSYKLISMGFQISD